MAYKPLLRDYRPFYIQTSGANTATDIYQQYGIVIQNHPYPILPEPKSPYSNDLPDANGEQEYNSTLVYKPQEFSYNCAVVVDGPVNETSMRACRSQIQSFFDVIKQGEFKIFDSYTDIGFQKVRYAGGSVDSGSYKSVGTGYTRALFTVKFKANDPVTRMVLVDGAIVTET